MNKLEVGRTMIVRKSPGRLRLRPTGWSGEARKDMEAHLRRLSGIRRVETNPLTGTLVIVYDPRAISAGEILAIVGVRESPGTLGA